MSDTRFTLLGIGLIFAGFIILGVFGAKYFDATIQADEFGDCFEYFEDMPPVEIDCESILQAKMMFSGLVIGLVGVGIASLVKGAKGRWDQDVKPEDMVGPGNPKSDTSDSSTKKED